MTDMPLSVWRVRSICCDGGMIGRTYSEHWFLSESAAEGWLDEKIKTENEKEVDRCRKGQTPCQWIKYEVDGLYGFCNWQYGMMYTIDKIVLPTK